MTPPSAFHLAQINIARFTLPKDHPANEGFMTALDPVNAQADTAPGFVIGSDAPRAHPRVSE